MTTPAQRSFHVSDVLTILTDRLVSTRGMDGVYDILGFMTDSQPFTHQLPRISDEVKPFLATEHPELAQVEVPEDFGDSHAEAKANIDAWLETIYAKFGTVVTVTRIPAEAHTEIDPITELSLRGISQDKIIVVSPEDPS